MKILKEQLDFFLDQLPDAADIRAEIAGSHSIYPFNEIAHVIAILLSRSVLSIEQYYGLRVAYITRNPFLEIFEISAPRTFGEKWAQSHLAALVTDLVKPSKRLDSKYSGQYDFLLDEGIRVEVKASRAVAAKIDGPLYVRALTSDAVEPFDMNFQQVKPACCDVFVWIAVWSDKIRYWILSSQELEAHRDYSTRQHRGNSGEGQLHLNHENVHDFDEYEFSSGEILRAIRAAHLRQLAARLAK